jgi:glycosyltransferase involved in cell wall biosynthesis
MIGAKRAARMAKHLAALGWEVRVLTVRSGFFDRTDASLIEESRVPATATLTLSPAVVARRLRRGLRAHRASSAGVADAATPATGPPRLPWWRRALSMPDEHAGWILPAVASGLLLRPRPDVILSSAPPFSAHVVAASLARLRGSRLVLDYRDPWTTGHQASLADSGRVPTPRLEAWCARRATAAIATTSSIAASLATLGPGKVAVIPNGVDQMETADLEPVRFPRFTIVYAGTFYGSRSARPVLLALRAIRTAGLGPPGGIALHVMGIASEGVRREAEALGVADWLETEDFQPYRRAMARMMGADLLLLVVGEAHAGMVPAKLFDYLAARRPILAIGPRDSEAGAILAEAGAGGVLETEDVDGIARRILEAAAGGGASAPVLPERYTARATMGALDRLLRDLL